MLRHLFFGDTLKKLLVIDNFDSFTYNLVQMFMCHRLSIHVHRSDSLSIDDIEVLDPDYILISPGPRDPLHAGISTPLVKHFHKRIPILGVCLGMQCINEAFGGKTVRSPLPVHGKTSIIRHSNDFIFRNIPENFRAARYHSLMVSGMKNELKVTCESEDRVVMGISHSRYPLHGIQFHPESFLTEYGHEIISNFLESGMQK